MGKSGSDASKKRLKSQDLRTNPRQDRVIRLFHMFLDTDIEIIDYLSKRGVISIDFISIFGRIGFKDIELISALVDEISHELVFPIAIHAHRRDGLVSSCIGGVTLRDATSFFQFYSLV